MSDLSTQFAKLSPEKRALLTQRLLQKRNGAAPMETIPRRTDSAALPLSYSQERLWVLEQLEPGALAYNIPLAIRIQGRLNHAALEQSLREIQRRHEILRTTFESLDGRPVQAISEEASLELTLVDLGKHPEPDREVEALCLAKDEAQQPLDLVNGPLLRARLLCLQEQEHILLLTMHHIVTDGWSMNIFWNELAQLYEAFCLGKPSSLAELPIQYADYALWQRQWLQGKVLEEQLVYWKRQLDGAPLVLELPVDHPRPAVQTYRGSFQPFKLSAELSEALVKLSQQQNATLFMTLLTAFVALLYRYSGQPDFVLGTPAANRNRAELENLIGFFVNTLVLRIPSLQNNPSFLELLSRLREMTLDAYAHQDLPFEKLVEILQPERNLSLAPIFQVMFILQPPPKDLSFHDLELQLLPFHGGTAKFDLLLGMINLPEGLAGSFEYSTDLFDPATIKRMAGHFEQLLQGLVANPEQRFADLPLLPEPERRQLLVEWNATQQEYPREKCFHHLFEAQAGQTPDAVAVVFEDQQLTYRELNARANQLAHYLRKIGVGPEVLVGLCVERSPEMLVGLLGVLKAGGAYVPLDPAYPPERIAHVLEDAKAPVLLTTQLTIANYQLSIDNYQLICLDTDWKAIAAENSENSAVAISPDNLAYAIYTSGSTGKPKGVAVSHRALVNFLNSMRAAPGLAAEDSLLAVTTLSFDIAGLELYLPLLVGARVVLASREVASDGRRLMTALDESGATVMQATPATWRMLIESNWQGNQNLKILCGGEALPRELANQLLDRCAELWNMYGPTETTIWSMVHKIDKREGLIAIGGPIDNTQIYLLDRHQQIIPIGVHGELCIGGDGLARGYLNRPDLTAEKFVPIADCGLRIADLGFRNEASEIHNPQSEIRDVRIYKTGDLARYLPDGKIDCLGRIDHQVKIRGFRIELGEIEAVCAQHPAIEQVVVVAREDEAQQKRLAAYLVAKMEPKPSVSELRQHLLQKLPDYMVPSAFVFLETLPLTPNGKVDRRALPAPEPTRSESKDNADEIKNPVEFLLSEIWVEVLGLTKVGLHDNFFELGGHSLLAVRLFLEIERSFNRSLPLASIFKAPTIKALAAMICDANAVSHSDCLVVLQEKGDKPPLFCVSGYEGHTFVFRQLARYLGDEQPVYGLHYPGLEGEQTPLDRIENIAVEFIRSIRRIQPRGPYQLCGYCFGGLVVYEMAQQLVRQGQTVGTLVLFDAMAPGGVRLHTSTSLSAGTGEIMDESLREIAAIAPLNFEPQIEATQNHNGHHTGASLIDWMEAVRRANMLAHNRYQPQSYPGRVILFVPTKRGEGWQDLSIDPRNGWGELAAGGVEVHSISGYHNKMFREPKVQKVAKKMRAYLNGVQNVKNPKPRQAALVEMQKSLEENMEAV